MRSLSSSSSSSSSNKMKTAIKPSRYVLYKNFEAKNAPLSPAAQDKKLRSITTKQTSGQKSPPLLVKSTSKVTPLPLDTDVKGYDMEPIDSSASAAADAKRRHDRQASLSEERSSLLQGSDQIAVVVQDPANLDDAKGAEDAADDKHEEDNADTGPDTEEWRKGRQTCENEIENQFNLRPFHEFDLFTGRKSIEFDSRRNVGKLKGYVRLVDGDNKNDESPLNLRELLSPQPYIVRVYVVRGHNLYPQDANGSCDPYLVVKLGKTVINDRVNHHKNTLQPNFYKCFELSTVLPGESLLRVSVMDYDLASFDDKIGATTIDLENLWFSPAWREMDRSPIEFRNLLHESCSVPQGKLEMWVDIMTPADAKRYPPIDIAPPPPEPFELRVIVWETRNCVIKDTITNQNDLMVSGRFEVKGLKPQETDVHFRSKKGFGSFNWRMKFPCELPMEDPRFTLMIWDKDYFSANDSICQGYISLKGLFKKAFRTKDAVSLEGPAGSILIKDEKGKALAYFDGGGVMDAMQGKIAQKTKKLWMSLRHPNFGEQQQGEVLVSFEVMPKAIAEQLPAGLGRSEPNMNPVLPEPTGRFKFDLFNPLGMLKDILGPELYRKACCFLCCGLFIALIVLMFPIIVGNVFTNLMTG